MTYNLDYFIKDCVSCKYDLGNENCETIKDEDCTNCKHKDTDGNCYCFKEANKALEHCPYYEENKDG